MNKRPEVSSILRLSQALGIPWAEEPKRPVTGPAWVAEAHGITQRTGYLIRWEQLKTVADARHWVDHIGRFHPALDADALRHTLEDVLQFCFTDDRPGTDFLGANSKVRHFLRQSSRRRRS